MKYAIVTWKRNGETIKTEGFIETTEQLKEFIEISIQMTGNGWKKKGEKIVIKEAK